MKKTGALLILSMLCGGLAGVIASVVTSQSLDEYAQQIAEGQVLFQLSEERPRPLPGTYEEALSRVQEAGWPATALVYEKTEDSVDAQRWITVEDAQATGAVVTSDGWVLFHRDAVAEYLDDVTQIEVWINGMRYDVQGVFEDTQTDIVLLQVNATALSTLAFGSSIDMDGGDFLFATPEPGEVVPTSLLDARASKDELVHRVESFSYEWDLPQEVPAFTPLLNSAGEIVGVSAEEGVAIPIHQIQPFIESVLRDQKVTHTGLGLYTVSLNQALNLDRDVLGVTTGEMVVSRTVGVPGIVFEGPADVAGIEQGDIILSVDDVLITEQQTLADLIADYDVGDSAELEILRNNDRFTVTVEFTELTNLYD